MKKIINGKEFLERMTSAEATKYRNGMSDVVIDYIEKNRFDLALIEDYACLQWVFMRCLATIMVDSMAQQIDLCSKKSFVDEAVKILRELKNEKREDELFRDIVAIFYDRLKGE